MEIDEIPLGRSKNLTGMKFGKLTALYKTLPTRPNNRKTYWKCQCECGNYTVVSSDKLTGNRIKSCGCLNGNPKPINIGNKYGRLTVIEFAGKDKQRHYLYKCKCNCGNTTIVPGYRLNSGRTQSCGCLKSKGEAKIVSILNNYSIQYMREYSFIDLKGKQLPLRFDFFVDNQYLIEYDGEGHYNECFNKNSLQQTQKYDKIKNEYCKSNNIPLIRIPYWHYKDITIEDLKPETSQFLIT